VNSDFCAESVSTVTFHFLKLDASFWNHMFRHSLCITPVGAKYKEDTGNTRISEFLYRLPQLLKVKVKFLQ
jgi:hypothetical protein